MNIFWAVFLGILQGLTEFLPISSSGHLVIAQYLIPTFSQPGVLFDTILHFGTLFSILVYFRRSLFKMNRNYFYLLAVGTIPAVVAGFFFRSFFEGLFENIKLVGLALLATAAMNYLISQTKTFPKIDMSRGQGFVKRSALFVGLFQALAIIPGISRSGATIFAGTKTGINKKQAAEFSFLLSVPAVLGANLLQFIKHGFSNELLTLNYTIGFLAAFISGYLAINTVFRLIQKPRFTIFAAYCFLLGIAVLIF